jgi:catalase
MSPEERNRLVANLVDALRDVPEAIQRRQIGHFYRADVEYGSRIAEDLGIAVTETIDTAA